MKPSSLPDQYVVVDKGVVLSKDATNCHPVSPDEVLACRRWIRQWVREAGEIRDKAYSYTLKHLVEKDSPETGNYVSNGAFIEAAILEGYQIEITGELNAMFNMILPDEEWQYIPPLGFSNWLFKQRERDDRIGDLARDAIADNTWPRQASKKNSFLAYLKKVSACDDAISSFKEAWIEFYFL